MRATTIFPIEADDMLSLIGKLVSGAIGWAIPGFSPMVLYGISALAILGSVAGMAYVKGAEGRGAAVAAANASCEIRMANMQTAAERTIADVLEHIKNNSEEEPKTPAEELKLCKASKLCRERVK
jgi:hypothetical protein